MREVHLVNREGLEGGESLGHKDQLDRKVKLDSRADRVSKDREDHLENLVNKDLLDLLENQV